MPAADASTSLFIICAVDRQAVGPPKPGAKTTSINELLRN